MVDADANRVLRIDADNDLMRDSGTHQQSRSVAKTCYRYVAL